MPAKYLNSPETPLFHKGGLLYNGAAARKAVHDGAQLIVVEGYVDVIAMVSAGFAGAVAPLGTALTEDQLGLLWKMSDEPLLCFDGDNAGRRAAYRAVEMALPRAGAGQESAVRAASRRAGPGRSRSLRRARRHDGGAGRRAPAGGNAVDARDRNRDCSTRRSAAPASRRGSTRSPTPSPTSR